MSISFITILLFRSGSAFNRETSGTLSKFFNPEDMEPLKRKLQEENNANRENKKPHNESVLSETQINAESTHIENDSLSLSNILKENDISEIEEDGSVNDSLVNTIISVVNTENKEETPLNAEIERLKNELNRKNEELCLLRIEKERLTFKVKSREEELNKYKKVILKLNDKVKIVDPENSRKVSTPKTRTKKAESQYCQ